MEQGQEQSSPGRKAWFGPKRFGYGISPKTWQGWFATLLFSLLLPASVFLIRFVISDRSGMFGAMIAAIMVETIGFIVFATVNSDGGYGKLGDD